MKQKEIQKVFDVSDLIKQQRQIKMFNETKSCREVLQFRNAFRFGHCVAFIRRQLKDNKVL